MNIIRGKGPIIDPGLCRCCGYSKKCRILSTQYESCGKKEVYSDIIMDCFGLVLSNLDGDDKDRLICATCVVRLRESFDFRQQILKCEELFLSQVHKVNITIDYGIKQEVKDEMEDNGTDFIRGNDEEYVDTTSKDEMILPDLNTEVVEMQEHPTKEKKNTLNKEERLNIKREMMRRIDNMSKLLKSKLEPVQAQPPIKTMDTQIKPVVTQIKSIDNQIKPPVPKPKRSPSPERMIHYNRVAIVENSYVYPFRNRISHYYCYYCREIFTDCNELRVHTYTHDPKEFESSADIKRMPKLDVTRIDCRLCPEKIEDLPTLKEHLLKIHKKKIFLNITDEFLPFKLSMDHLSCLECGQGFQFIDKIVDHMTAHYGKYVCDVCGSFFIDELSLRTHIRKHSKVDIDFPCEVCGKNLKSSYSRWLHVTTVHEKKPVVGCFKCDESFLSYAQRNRHLINVHGDKRKFPCKTCDKVFDVRKTMMEHVRKYHLQVTRHQCDICGKKFFCPSNLQEHKATHSVENSFQCDLCDKSYPRRFSLIDHMRTHSTEKKFKCSYCSSSFTQNSSLKYHLKMQHPAFELTGFV